MLSKKKHHNIQVPSKRTITIFFFKKETLYCIFMTKNIKYIECVYTEHKHNVLFQYNFRACQRIHIIWIYFLQTKVKYSISQSKSMKF
jgi:hypothetical protein